jgi:hypothetical protein
MQSEAAKPPENEEENPFVNEENCIPIHIKDLSLGGLLSQSDSRLELGEEIIISFLLKTELFSLVPQYAERLIRTKHIAMDVNSSIPVMQKSILCTNFAAGTNEPNTYPQTINRVKFRFGETFFISTANLPFGIVDILFRTESGVCDMVYSVVLSLLHTAKRLRSGIRA